MDTSQLDIRLLPAQNHFQTIPCFSNPLFWKVVNNARLALASETPKLRMGEFLGRGTGGTYIFVEGYSWMLQPMSSVFSRTEIQFDYCMKNKVGTILQASVKSLEVRQKTRELLGHGKTRKSWILLPQTQLILHTKYGCTGYLN